MKTSNNMVLGKVIRVYHLYDWTGKVMETQDAKQAKEWDQEGKTKRLPSGQVSKYVKAKTTIVQ